MGQMCAVGNHPGKSIRRGRFAVQSDGFQGSQPRMRNAKWSATALLSVKLVRPLPFRRSLSPISPPSCRQSAVSNCSPLP